MIFVTVGSQLPFDRLIKYIDKNIASSSDIEDEFYAQIGTSDYVPKNMQYCNIMSQNEWDSHANNSNIIISHAGMGTILSCMKMSKPLVMLPRRHSMKEVRTDHQVSTAEKIRHIEGLYVADHEEQLFDCIRNSGRKVVDGKFESDNYKMLVRELRKFIDNIK